MRIKIIVDDWHLKNWYGLAKGATRKVEKVVYVNQKRKNPNEIVGYKVMAVHLYDSNIKGQFSPIFIRKNECVEIKDYSNQS